MPNAAPRLTYNSCQVLRWMNFYIAFIEFAKSGVGGLS